MSDFSMSYVINDKVQTLNTLDINYPDIIVLAKPFIHWHENVMLRAAYYYKNAENLNPTVLLYFFNV